MAKYQQGLGECPGCPLCSGPARGEEEEFEEGTSEEINDLIDKGEW